jgi:hypothetical protein
VTSAAYRLRHAPNSSLWQPIRLGDGPARGRPARAALALRSAGCVCPQTLHGPSRAAADASPALWAVHAPGKGFACNIHRYHGPPAGPAYPRVQCAATHRVGERPSQGLSFEYSGNGGSNGGRHLDAGDGRGRRGCGGCLRNVGNSTRRALGVTGT